MYSKKEIEKLFRKIRSKSYKDLPPNTRVYTNIKWTIGFSSPFNGNIYVDLSLIKNYSFSKKAVVGLLAHELVHQVSYRKRSFLGKWFFLWNYYFSSIKEGQ